MADLIAAVAALGTKDIAGQAFRMQTHQDAVRIADIPLNQRHMLGSIHFVSVNDCLVHAAMDCRKDLLGGSLDLSVAYQVSVTYLPSKAQAARLTGKQADRQRLELRHRGAR